MRHALLISLLLAVPVLASPADEAYAEAKEALAKLKKDPTKKKLKHHWLAVAKRFAAVAAKYSKTERCPEAWYMHAEVMNELSRFSGDADDMAEAERSYRKLTEAYPTHRLSDDASLAWAKLVADKRKDKAAARRIAQAALTSANDKKKALAQLLEVLPAGAAVSPKVAPAKPEVRREEHAPVAAKASAQPKEKATLVDAIARLARTVKPLEAETATPVRHPPVVRAPVEEEEGPPADSNDEVHENSASTPLVESLAERLRDVRVGASPAGEAAAAKARLKASAAAQASAEVSLAQQLGLKVRRVIIDAGHGGHDTGAIGAKGTREKDVTLTIVKKLAELLESQGLEVVLTRSDDTYVALEERTRIANAKHGDLFISVHCNAAPTKTLRGVETYTLNTSSNRYSIRLAARENATTERGVGDLQYILADLATKANTGESAQLADLVQRSVVRGLSKDWAGIKNLGTKEALFFVLLGAKMPSILVETSFLSHPEEELRLADESYQERIAESIAEAVQAFLEARNKVARVD
jgi:N-acetylmuramoyl-L-alanine amidase